MITMRDIEIAVCSVYNITKDQLVVVRSARHFARPRQVVMYLARKHTSNSYPQIGAFLYRDHTTILHGERAVARHIQEDPSFAREVSACEVVLEDIRRHHLMQASINAKSMLAARRAA